MFSPDSVTGEVPVSASGRTIMSWQIFSVSVMPASSSSARFTVGSGVGSGVAEGVDSGLGMLCSAGAPQADRSSAEASRRATSDFFICY